MATNESGLPTLEKIYIWQTCVASSKRGTGLNIVPSLKRELCGCVYVLCRYYTFLGGCVSRPLGYPQGMIKQAYMAMLRWCN